MKISNIDSFFILTASVVIGLYPVFGSVNLLKKELDIMPTKVAKQFVVEKTIKKEKIQQIKTGLATWYDYDLSGIKDYSKSHRTCASRDFKRYSHVKVTNISNGRSVICFVNDYGPELKTGKDLDLSSYAFSQIANLSSGVIKVKIEPYE